MAKSYALLITLALLLTFGCQSQRPLVENVPPPNFNGPTIAPNAAPPRPQYAQTWTPPTRAQPAPRAGGVPREWMPASSARPWKWIVIHHSATPSGSARSFDRMHKEKGWDELGYHFVIGNGTETSDGGVEVGSRWTKQKWGAHAKTPDNQFNEFGVGICLVGNFDIERPTPAQLNALARLTAHLMKQYRIPASRVMGHSDTGKPTECPGRNMNLATVRTLATRMLADAGEAIDDVPAAQTASSTDLLADVPETP